MRITTEVSLTPEYIANELGGALLEQNGSWLARCPVHPDKNPSLLISSGQRQPIIVYCRAGCDQSTLISTLTDLNLWPIPSKATQVKKKIGRLKAVYKYNDVDGTYLFEKRRYEQRKNGEVDKTFLIGVSDPKTGDRFRPGQPKLAQLPLYNLPALTPFRESGDTKVQPIFIVEGEKDVDNLSNLGEVAVCNCDGAGGASGSKWQAHYNEVFKTLDVVVVPDCDAIGREHAARVALEILPYARSVRLLDLGLEDKGDISDWLAAGGTREELTELVKGLLPAARKDLMNLLNKADPSWKNRLNTTKQGSFDRTLINASVPLRYAPEFCGRLCLNLFNQRIEVSEPMPWDQPGAVFPRPWSDLDTRALTIWCQKERLKISSVTAHEAAFVVGEQRQYDPLKEYLQGVQWDGTPRLDNMLKTYFAAEGHSKYLCEVGARWMISAVARGLKPGTKADHVLVLEGAQGALKSSALAVLAVREDWFSDDLPSFKTKDGQLALQGRWIIEVSELEAMNRSEIGNIKEFLSRRVDKFRPPYGRAVQDFPRRCVLGGSWNPDGAGWIKDSTGGRRFWPVQVSGKICIADLNRDRDQLWAEAVRRFKAGEIWWIEDEEALALVLAEQDARHDQHPLAEEVLRYITHAPVWDQAFEESSTQISWEPRQEKLEIFFPKDFWRDRFGQDATKVRRDEQLAISRTMQKLGWKKGTYRHPEDRHPTNGWRVPPDNGKNFVTDLSPEIGYRKNDVESLSYHHVTDVTDTSSQTENRFPQTGGHSTLGFCIDPSVTSVTPASTTVQVVADLGKARTTIETITSDGITGLDFETVGLRPWEADNRCRLLQLWRDGAGVVVDLDKVGGLESVVDVLANKRFVAFNATFEMSWLRAAGIDLVVDDALLAYGGCFGGTISLQIAARRFLKIDLDKSWQKSDWSGDLCEEQLVYALRDAEVALLLWQHFATMMEQADVRRGYELLRNSQRIVCRMQEAGMTLDVERHRALVARQERGLGLADRFLDRRVPGVTNWNSPRQVNRWLQDAVPDDLYSRWPRTPKSRALKLGGEVIKPMLPEMPANLRRILSTYLFRKDRAKLVASFGEALIEKVRPETGRVHTSLHVCAAVTGRMSASEPNLQQMPQKKTFRNLFTVPDGQKLIVADYSQIEIRVAALLSKEPALYNAFADGADIHKATAAGMFKIPDDQVSREQRQRAKEITFGMLYGMGEKSLAGALGVSRTEAQVWVRAWRESYPVLARWRRGQVSNVKQRRTLRTAGGRRIVFRGNPSPQQCFNYPVQSGAADVLYAALGVLDRRLDGSELSAIPLNVIHDEIVLEAPENEAQSAAKLLCESMIEGFLMIFPDAETCGLVDVSVRDSWGSEIETH